MIDQKRTAEGTPVKRASAPKRRRRSRLRGLLVRLAAMALAILICLSLLEVGFRVAGYEPIYKAYSKPELFWRHDALLGWSLDPGSRGTYVGPRPFPVEFRTPVRINSAGLRGAPLTPVAPGGKRVLVLGDSFVAGFEVAEGETYVSLLEQQLSSAAPVQVINGGVRGYGTDQAYLYYRERGRLLDPDIVVLHETRNDPEDNTTLHRMRRPFGKPAFAAAPDGSLQLVGTPVPEYPQCSAQRVDASGRAVRIDSGRSRAFCWLQTRLADHSAFLTFVTTRLQRNPALVKKVYDLGTPEGQAASPDAPAEAPEATPGPLASPSPPDGPTPPPPGDHAHQLTSRLIRQLAADVKADGARMVLLAGDDELPQLDQQGFVADGVEVVRVDQAQPPGDRAAHFSDGHMNALGHRRVADFLAPLLQAMLRQ